MNSMHDTRPVGFDARDLLLGQFAWHEGHANIWRVFRDPTALAAVVTAMVEPFRDAGITAVAGVESRGFLLGGAAAVQLGLGFVAVRKAGALFPGPKFRQRTEPDYRRNRTELLLQQESLGPGDRVLLVDDWVETGNQALVVQDLVCAAGAALVGLSVLVDGLADQARARLPTVHSLVRFDELPADDADLRPTR